MEKTDESMLKAMYSDESPVAQFRSKMMGDGLFVNFGISLDGKKPADIKTANMNMVDWVIKKLGITKDSYILEVGCGKGGYILGIAQKTGCKFLGIDIFPLYVEKGKKNIAERGLSDKGDIIEGSYQDFSKSFDHNISLTHIISFGSMYYAHPDIDLVLDNFASVSRENTKVLIWDHVAVDAKKPCTNFKRHMPLGHDLLDLAEFNAALNRSKFKVDEYEDQVHITLPALSILRDAALEEDPESSKITFPLMYKAFTEKEILYPTWILSLKRAQ